MRILVLVLLCVAGCSAQPSTPTPTYQPPPVSTLSRPPDPQAAAWMERFCDVVGDIKTNTQVASKADASTPNELKFRMSTMLAVIGNDLPHSMGRLDVLSRSPVPNGEQLIASLTRELMTAQRAIEQARRDIDVLSGHDEGEVQRIMKPIDPLVGTLSTFPLRLVVVDDALRNAGDAEPACKGILDHDNPPR